MIKIFKNLAKFVLTLLLLTPSILYMNKSKLFDKYAHELKRNWNSKPRQKDWKDWERNMDIIVRTTCDNRFILEFNRWYVPSYKMFWRFNNTRVKVILDAENKNDSYCIQNFAKNLRNADIVFRQPARDPSIYKHSGRQMWDNFYPEAFTHAQYVAFMDTDSMFVTTVTPESLFKDNMKPVVNARIGLDRVDHRTSCLSAATFYFLDVKETMNCMSYFPVIYKTQHIINTRLYIETRHNKTFNEVYRGAFKHCEEQCQYNVICNYIWHHHRDEYDWHFMTIGGILPNNGRGSFRPNTGMWNGEGRKPSQVSAEYIKQLNESYKVPKHRVAIHARHFIDSATKMFTPNRRLFREPTLSQLKYHLRHGLCLSFGFEHCPSHCKDIHPGNLQTGMFSFEEYEWFYDNRCIGDQEKHYREVKRFYDKYGIQPKCNFIDLIKRYSPNVFVKYIVN